jgi:inosine/xanthosine triphosphate pyrophosphatase family protein
MSDDLLEGLKMLQESVQRYKIGSAITGAQTQIDQANKEIQDESELRKFQQGLANKLSLQLTGLGAPVSQIQSAFASLAPKQYSSLGEAQLDASLTGNKALESQIGGLAKAQRMAEQDQKKALEQIQLSSDLKKIAASGAENRKTQAAELAGKLTLLDRKLTDDSGDLVPGLRQIPGAKINKVAVNKVQEMASAKNNLKSLLNEYSGMLKEVGTEFAGEDASYMETLVTNIDVAWKEAAKLGALTGPDLALIKAAVPDATSLKENLKSFINPSNASKIKGTLDKAVKRLDTSFNQQIKPFGFTQPNLAADIVGAGARAPAESKYVSVYGSPLADKMVLKVQNDIERLSKIATAQPNNKMVKRMLETAKSKLKEIQK